MRAIIKLILVMEMLGTMAPASSRENIVWVNVNYFESERRLLGIQHAHQNFSEGKPRLFISPIGGPFSRISEREARKLIRRETLMDQVMREKGIEPVHQYPSECTGTPGEFAYVEAYNRTIDAGLKEKLGADYLQDFEAEVDRRARKAENRK